MPTPNPQTILYRHAVKCPSCGKKTFLLTAVDDHTCACPFCEHTFPIPLDRESKLNKVASDSVLGFSLSAAIHIIILAILATVTWLYVEGGGHGPDATQVGLVTEGKADTIEAGAAPGTLETHISMTPVKVDINDVKPQLDVQTVQIQTPNAAPNAAKSISGQAISDLAIAGGNSGMAEMGTAGLIGGAGTMGGGKTNFFGTEAEGPFVYVLDCSGSMGRGEGSKLYACKQELKKSIRMLNSASRYYVIFFSSTHYEMPPQPKLVRATQKNKTATFAWVDSFHHNGGTAPASAMELALSLKPQTIFLLTDGNFGAPPVLEAIKKGNPRKRIIINTIAFHDRGGEAILKQIAEDNKGTFRFVSR